VYRNVLKNEIMALPTDDLKSVNPWAQEVPEFKELQIWLLGKHEDT